VSSANHVRVPEAPAKWATAVSQAMTQVKASDDGGGVHERPRLAIEIVAKHGDLAGPLARQKTDQPHARKPSDRFERTQRKTPFPVPQVIRASLPSDPYPESSQGGQPSLPLADKFRSRL